MKVKFVPEIKMMSPYELDPAPFNPPKRTSDKYLESLEEAVKEIGGIVVPVIISKDKRIIDGHRRVAVAKKLNLTEIPCIVTSLELQSGFSTLNDVSMNIENRDWLWMYSYGCSLENFPDKPAKALRKVENLIGKEGINLMAEKGLTYGPVLSESQASTKYIEGIPSGSRIQPDQELKASVMWWLIKHGQILAARFFRESEGSPQIMRTAVNEGWALGKAKW